MSSRCAKCKKEKPKGLVGIKIDAAQFFKAANLKRGLHNIDRLLRRVQKKHKCNAVALSKSAKLSGMFCHANRADTQHHTTISFKSIRDFCSVAYGDTFFMVGNVGIRRREGYPMGGALSEPGTLVDLSEPVRLLHEMKYVQGVVDWDVDNYDVKQVVAGWQHVDDCFFCSGLLCADCIMKGVETLWPRDVGVSIEEKGDIIPFLHSTLVITPQKIFVLPSNPNVDFISGLSPDPKVSRISRYLGSHVHKLVHLKRFLWAQIMMYDQLMAGEVADTYPYLLALLRELGMLKWPIKLVGAALRGLPKRHGSAFMRVCRSLGRLFCGKLIDPTLELEQFVDPVFLAQSIRDRPLTSQAFGQKILKQLDSMGGKGKGKGWSGGQWWPRWNGANNWNNWGGLNGQNQPQVIVQQPTAQPQVYAQPGMQMQAPAQVLAPTVIAQNPPVTFANSQVQTQMVQTQVINPDGSITWQQTPTIVQVPQQTSGISQAISQLSLSGIVTGARNMLTAPLQALSSLTQSDKDAIVTQHLMSAAEQQQAQNVQSMANAVAARIGAGAAAELMPEASRAPAFSGVKGLLSAAWQGTPSLMNPSADQNVMMASPAAANQPLTQAQASQMLAEMQKMNASPGKKRSLKAASSDESVNSEGEPKWLAKARKFAQASNDAMKAKVAAQLIAEGAEAPTTEAGASAGVKTTRRRKPNKIDVVDVDEAEGGGPTAKPKVKKLRTKRDADDERYSQVRWAREMISNELVAPADLETINFEDQWLTTMEQNINKDKLIELCQSQSPEVESKGTTSEILTRLADSLMPQ